MTGWRALTEASTSPSASMSDDERQSYDHPDLGTMGGYETGPPGIVILLMVIAVAVLVMVTR